MKPTPIVLCAPPAKTVVPWDNRNAPGRCGNTTQGLTRSLDLTKEGLAMQATRICAVPDCDNAHESRGYCVAHYRRFMRHGDPLAGRSNAGKAPVAERLARRLRDTPTGCMEWVGDKYANGYGRIRSGEAPYRGLYAHRVAWSIANGTPVPDGALVCHTCDNRLCCNAAHLFLGSHADNMRDMTDKGRQARGRSHPNAVLTEADVLEILRLRSLGMTHAAISDKVGTSDMNVGKICRGERWGHVVEVTR